VSERTADITIVGLGPGDPARRTVEVQEALDSAQQIFLRADGHPNIDDLTTRPGVVICDGMRRGKWSEAVDAICAAGSEHPVVLAVPGHPRYGERIVVKTIAEARQQGLTIRVLGGLSAIDLVSIALDMDPLIDDLQIVDARQIVDAIGDDTFGGGLFPFTPLRSMLFSRVHDATVTRGLARLLARVFPGRHQVTVLQAAGIDGQERISITTVAELLDLDPGQLVSFWVPPLDTLDAHRDPRTLQHIIARLRAPAGCPWDRKQTTGSLRNGLIDEVYEAVDAIDAGDMDNLAEELGDLVLLIVMHAQIAEEAGHFTLEDVYEGITTKIIRRHPHVFGDHENSDDMDVVGLWKRVKSEEKASGKVSSTEKAADGQPRSMPAITRAGRVLQKHPLPQDGTGPKGPGGEMLALIAGIIAAGDDPDAVLRDALNHHVEASTSASK